jgi:hypothetical protein
MGWKPLTPDDYSILFVKLKQVNGDTSLQFKSILDAAILKSLREKHLGDQAENDEETETDLHFVVSKNDEKALTAIYLAGRQLRLEQHITIYRREYVSPEKWTDKLVSAKANMPQ